MKAIIRENLLSRRLNCLFTRALIVAVILFVLLPAVRAISIDPGGGGTNSAPTYTPLDSWTFFDSTNWTSDLGYAPVSFTNLAYSYLGNGSSLLLDSPDPAWLQFNVQENDGTTNLTVDAGTVMFWFAPNSWSSTNQGGIGPGEYGRLFEVGSYSPDSSFGWWSIYVDDAGANLYFSAQTNDLSSNVCAYLSYPIGWTTNYFHHIALTFSATNTALYLDGALATNGPPMTVYPGLNVLANGFFIGSDSNGVAQARGLFNSVATYSSPLDAGTIQGIFNEQIPWLYLNPLNKAMNSFASASSAPSFSNGYQAITGAGNLIWTNYAGECDYGTNACDIWFTNVSASVAGPHSVNVTFTIEGGTNGYFYDVFATGNLQSPLTNAIWIWLGQGQRCNTYTVNIPSPSACLVMGTPQDSNGDGITDAYSLLIAHIDPNQTATTDDYGVPYAWYVQNGLNPNGAATQDPDGDALLNYQEYLYGTQPQVSEGFGIWTTIGTTSIP